MKNIIFDVFGEFGVQTVAYMGVILAVLVFIFLLSRFRRH
jgi:hypothetical protein